MKSWRFFVAALILISFHPIGRAQDAKPQETKPAETKPAEAQAAPQPPPVFEYSGKPIVLPFQCTEDDIQWAGLSCPEDDPCAVFLELNIVESVGQRIIAGGNIHTSSVTLYSVLLASDDGGHSWREVHERIRGAALEHIQFLDAENGWISGAIVFPLSQDPFVLATSDGGKTWRRVQIFDEGRENRYGAIQQFGFSAKNSGTLIIDRGPGSDGDRYEAYESPNAGESWTIKETSNKPLRVRLPPAASTTWRVRADGATQSYEIDHRQGERWIKSAAFAVKLNACKPQP